MPLEQAVWRIDGQLKKLDPSQLAKEIDLEKFIEKDISILNPNWLIIGLQVASDVGPIDLLALDRSGALIVIELKRSQTTRDITAQALDYASWVEDLTSDKIAGIFTTYCTKYRPQDSLLTINEAFRRRFEDDLPTEQLNESHQIVLVASELDARTERIVRYLHGRGIDMNILFFQIFSDDDRTFLSRVWMLDQVEIEEQKSKGQSDGSVPWNGEYYVSFGDGDRRSWDDAVRYGFISAGGGRWYMNTLTLLNPGARIWVNVPGVGYVGVGEVTGTVQRASEFKVTTDNGTLMSVLDVSKDRVELMEHIDDLDRSEYFVPVRWIKTLPLANALKEVGLFGNQNSVCQPKSAKWNHTIDRLKQLLNVT